MLMVGVFVAMHVQYICTDIDTVQNHTSLYRLEQSISDGTTQCLVAVSNVPLAILVH